MNHYGIENHGNQCFMNSTIQALLSIFQDSLDDNQLFTKNSFSLLLREILKSLSRSNKTNNIQIFWDYLYQLQQGGNLFNPNDQKPQDACEVLMIILQQAELTAHFQIQYQSIYQSKFIEFPLALDIPEPIIYITLIKDKQYRVYLSEFETQSIQEIILYLFESKLISTKEVFSYAANFNSLEIISQAKNQTIGEIFREAKDKTQQIYLIESQFQCFDIKFTVRFLINDFGLWRTFTHARPVFLNFNESTILQLNQQIKNFIPIEEPNFKIFHREKVIREIQDILDMISINDDIENLDCKIFSNNTQLNQMNTYFEWNKKPIRDVKKKNFDYNYLSIIFNLQLMK